MKTKAASPSMSRQLVWSLVDWTARDSPLLMRRELCTFCVCGKGTGAHCLYDDLGIHLLLRIMFAYKLWACIHESSGSDIQARNEDHACWLRFGV